MITNRLSGTLANRPPAGAARDSFYLVLTPEIFTVDFGILVGSGIAGKFISTADAAGPVYFWFQGGGNIDPAPGGRGIMIAILIADNATQIATKFAAVVDASFKFSIAGKVVTVTNTSGGTRTDAAAGLSGTVIVTTQQGAAPGPVYQSQGDNWFPRTSLDESDNAGFLSGLDAAKPVSSSCVAHIYHSTDSGIQYEAFPNAWFALP